MFMPMDVSQCDPGMLSLAVDVVDLDEIAIAVQKDLHNPERHLSTLQLRKFNLKHQLPLIFNPHLLSVAEAAHA